jgi:hypothetical protein
MLCPSTSPTEPRQQEQSATLSSGHARPTERVAVPAKSNTPPLAPLPAPRAVLRQAEKLANARQKSTASSPARPSTRARAARTSSAASARPCRSSRRPTQSRRRDAARRTHGVTMYCTCTLVAVCDCDCGASTTRYACHVQCNCANMSTSHVKFHGVQDVSFWSITLFQRRLPVCASPPFPIAGAWLC